MTGETLIEGLEGLSKIDGLSDIVFNIIYWVAVVFVLLFVAYICSWIMCQINRKRKGDSRNADDFLDD